MHLRSTPRALGRPGWCCLALLLCFVGLLFPAPARAEGAALASLDFTQPAVAGQWQPQHDLSDFEQASEGLAMTISGPDPYFAGPPQDYPSNAPLRLCLRLKSDRGGSGQLFYFRDRPTEEHSVRFQVLQGGWREVRLRLPALGPGYRFRIDPPGQAGQFVLASLEARPDVNWAPPVWPAPVAVGAGEGAVSLESGRLTFTHHPGVLGGFELRVQGALMAVGHTRPMLGYLADDQPRWVSVNEAAGRDCTVRPDRGAVEISSSFTDPDGARWRVDQQFRPSRVADVVDLVTRIQVDRERQVIFLPVLTLLPGVGSFGQGKNQGLFAGLEYLANEPSSSEADVQGPAARRLVPDTLKITFPLMVIQADHRYVGLAWEMQPQLCALFDSPDRTFQAGGHVLALLCPGSNGADRQDGNLLPQDGLLLAPNQPWEVRATILGGPGESVVPAVQKYVEVRGLPPLPKAIDLQEYVRLAAAGWLDSKIREGDLFLHAVWPNWQGGPAADAPFYMDWLSDRAEDAALSERLAATARAALAQVRPSLYYSAGVGHVRFPVAPLVYGHVLENVAHAREVGRNLLGRFEPDGRVLYRKSGSKPDYGRTHFAPDANGLTAQVVMSLLDAAAFSGDRDLVERALERLGGLDKFRDTVPRGAQTWEVPLHTPDILASAYLVRAYLAGYELSGEGRFLEQARYWAWTGVPFIYLRNPAEHPIGPYLTPPVYGATSWVAPVWMGLPVQWCGLVYADALYRLLRHDPTGPWQQLADGITIGGIQITWPLADPVRQGLLPDVFHLREQHRDGPAINPGTVQACASRYYSRRPLYDFRVVRDFGLLLHAPGEIGAPRLESGQVHFTVEPWPQRPCYLLVNGLKQAPGVRIDQRETALEPPHEYRDGQLVLQVEKRAQIVLDLK